MSLIRLTFLGETSYENYDKVEKWFAKREEKLLDRGIRRGPSFRGRGRGFGYGSGFGSGYGSHGYHPYHNYHHNSHSNGASAFPPPLMSQSPSPAATISRPPMDKSKMRCNKCQELGHFFRECPNGFPTK